MLEARELENVSAAVVVFPWRVFVTVIVWIEAGDRDEANRVEELRDCWRVGVVGDGDDITEIEEMTDGWVAVLREVRNGVTTSEEVLDKLAEENEEALVEEFWLASKWTWKLLKRDVREVNDWIAVADSDSVQLSEVVRLKIGAEEMLDSTTTSEVLGFLFTAATEDEAEVSGAL